MTTDVRPSMWHLINEPFSYLHEPYVHLETADRRLFAKPYGPRFPKAVGKVFCLEPIQGGERTEIKVSYVKRISPWIFDNRVGDHMRILVLEERPLPHHGEQFVVAEILSSPDGMTKKNEGVRIFIVLYSNLTEETKRALLIQSIIECVLNVMHLMTKDEQDALGVEQHIATLKAGWTKMSIDELELQCKKLVGSLPY